MSVRNQAVDEPFKTSQGPSTEHDKKPKPVKVTTNLSNGVRNIGQPDPLSQALKKPPPMIPSGEHSWSHGKTPQARGALYHPAGEFGRPTTGSIGHSRATGMSRHTNRPGGNPLGSAPNRKGDNPLGHTSNKHGTNPLGKAMNRVGTNAVGKNMNRQGQKSGYPSFRPTGGGKNV